MADAEYGMGQGLKGKYKDIGGGLHAPVVSLDGAALGTVDQGAAGATPWKVDDDATQVILAAVQALLAAGLPSALSSDRLKAEVTGTVAAGTADSGNPVKLGGVYKATPATRADGQRSDLTTDANENFRATLGTLLAGESLAFNRQFVNPLWTGFRITTQTTTVVKASPGILGFILIPIMVANAVVTVYDNTAGSGTILAVLTMPAVPVANGPISIPLNLNAATGITIVTSVATMEVDGGFL